MCGSASPFRARQGYDRSTGLYVSGGSTWLQVGEGSMMGQDGPGWGWVRWDERRRDESDERQVGPQTMRPGEVEGTSGPCALSGLANLACMDGIFLGHRRAPSSKGFSRARARDAVRSCYIWKREPVPYSRGYPISKHHLSRITRNTLEPPPSARKHLGASRSQSGSTEYLDTLYTVLVALAPEPTHSHNGIPTHVKDLQSSARSQEFTTYLPLDFRVLDPCTPLTYPYQSS